MRAIIAQYQGDTPTRFNPTRLIQQLDLIQQLHLYIHLKKAGVCLPVFNSQL